MAARALNQSSKLGEILDMITDRCSIACILGTLVHLYPKHGWFWLLCIALDVGSHWYQQYASALCGEHHKKAKAYFTLIRWYYEKRWFLGLNCFGAEVFCVCSYALYFIINKDPQMAIFFPYKKLLVILQHLFGIIFVFKVVIVNTFQFISAM